MKRIAVTAGALSACGALMLISLGGCSNREGLLEPSEKPWRHYPSVQSFDEPVLVVEPDVIVAVPAAGEFRMVDDPWICGLILSMLPAKERERFFSLGVVYVDDLWAAAEIVSLAGMSGAGVSGGVWVGSNMPWGCIKCGFTDPPCCSPWPACCSKDKNMYHKDVFEMQ